MLTLARFLVLLTADDTSLRYDVHIERVGGKRAWRAEIRSNQVASRQ